MNLLELAKRAVPAHQPVFTGTWGVLCLIPDLGSRQEFIVGAAVAIGGDRSLHVRWVPSLSKLSKFYGDSTSTPDLQELVDGCATALALGSQRGLVGLDLGTPHIRLVECGYFAANDVDAELTQLLKRHTAAIWPEAGQREARMDDEWAYSEMLKALDSMRISKDIIVPGRHKVISNRNFEIAFDNKKSYGAVVSARYSHFSTVERHILRAQMNLSAAHKLDNRGGNKPALFVMLPYSLATPEDVTLVQKSAELLSDVEDTGVQPFTGTEAADLARALEAWAMT